MNAMPCKHEGEMIAALRSGAWAAELLEHCSGCSECRQTRLVAEALHRDAEMLQASSGPPPAVRVWAAVQRQQGMAALERATRFLRVLKVAGVVYAAVFLFWSLRSLPNLAPGSLLSGLNGRALNESMIAAGLAVLFIGSGLWYALRRDRLAVE